MTSLSYSNSHASLTSLHTKPWTRQQWQRSADNRPRPRTHRHAATRSATDNHRSLQTRLMTKIRCRCFASRIPMTFSCLETRQQGIHRSLLGPRDSWPADDQRSSKHPGLNCNPDLCYLMGEKQGIGIAKKKIHISNHATFGPLTGQGISQFLPKTGAERT